MSTLSYQVQSNYHAFWSGLPVKGCDGIMQTAGLTTELLMERLWQTKTDSLSKLAL